MRTMQRLAVFATCAFATLGQPACGLDWPVSSRIITGTFGEDRGDHFHNGIDIGGGSQDVHPVLPGELVFRFDDASDYSSLPRGVGSFVVSPFLNRSTKTWYQMASFDHFGTEARFSFFASCWQHTDNKLNAVVRNSTVLIDLFIIIRLNIAYFNPPLAPPGRGIIFNFLLSPYIDLVPPWIKCKIYT